jgi:ubiquinone/menaquinone biosynthesis C-methylase UbiE
MKWSREHSYKKDKPISNLSFNFMSFYFRIRDFFSAPINILNQLDIIPGSHILDYGCGSGSYSIPAAEIVGHAGKVFAADIHTIAIREVMKKANFRGYNNIQTILTDCKTDLSNSSIDIVLLFYVLHDFKDPDLIVDELATVLKSAGRLIVIDHKFDNEKIISVIGHATNELKLKETKNRILIFSKDNNFRRTVDT